MSDDRSILETASDQCKTINDELAETDAVYQMALFGAIGYHQFVATGETDPEYLWKIALLSAFEDQVCRELFVDADTAVGAREQIEGGLERAFDPFTAEAIAEDFEETLAELIERQREIAANGGELA